MSPLIRGPLGFLAGWADSGRLAIINLQYCYYGL